MMTEYLVRAVSSAYATDDGVACRVRAVACVDTPGMPGYLTGEPYDVQGIETSLPNLPDLDLPDTHERELALHARIVHRDTVRLTIAPLGAAMLDDDGTGPGVLVRSAVDPAHDSSVSDSEVVLRTDGLCVRIGRSPFSVQVEDRAAGSVVLRTAERLRQAAGVPMAPGVLVADTHVTLHLELGPDEQVVGFGEQFSPVVKNGQRLKLSVADALGTGTGQAYKPVPVWHSTSGYSGLVNGGALVEADVGHTRPSVLGLTVHDEAADVYVTAGPDPKERLATYTALTGRADVPPLWAFGYWMGRCRYHSATEMLDVADGMRRHGIPCDVLHLDPDWLVTDRLNCDFIWNDTRFGERRAFVSDLADRGVRLSVWELPYLDPASPRYAEAEEKGYLVRTEDGDTAQVAGTPTPDGRHRALVDFTDPGAAAWWQDLHSDFLDDGVAVFKTDFGEGLPADARLSDGTPPNQAHNLYPLRYNATVSDGIRRLTGRAPLVWGRSGWAGSHRYPGQWGGDAESTVAGMRATLRGGLSYALSAPGLWGHDIGGFFGPELTPALYVRWTQFGALSPMMRAHGLRPREPWAFDADALRIAREWIRLRYRLLPYLWQVVHGSLADGLPVLRPIAMESPDDPVAVRLDAQYMLGPDLLVAPVFDDSPGPAEHTFYVPEGGWSDLLTGERYAGPRHVTRRVQLDEMPVLVRDGTVVPQVEVRDDVRNTDDLVGRAWTLHTYGGGEPADVDLTGFDGSRTCVTVRAGRAGAEGTQPVDEAVVQR